MPKITSVAPGTFCWVDLATNDPAAAKTFYTGLFGWSVEDLPTDQGPPYSMLRQDGVDVCALFQLAPDMGDPPRWQAYVAVEDVDTTTAKAVELGARLFMPPMDVMEFGRMAVIQDPTGAALCLWLDRTRKGSALRNEPGAQCWLELQTKDTSMAATFYRDLFGWEARTSESVMEGQYHLFSLGEIEVGGMLQIQDDWGPVPPNWCVYFGVADCDGSLAQAERLGGKILFPAMEIENVGRFAFLQDPQGAVFAVIQLAHPC